MVKVKVEKRNEILKKVEKFEPVERNFPPDVESFNQI